MFEQEESISVPRPAEVTVILVGRRFVALGKAHGSAGIAGRLPAVPSQASAAGAAG